MLDEKWKMVDQYINDLLIPSDSILDEVLQVCEMAGLPPHHVAPNQGKFLQLLAQLRGARNILEIGTLGGYSTIWLARALPIEGKLITLEVNPKHAEVAQANIAKACLSNVVEIQVGNALDSLNRLVSEKRGPFDLIFIDADKPNNPKYLELALKLSRPGSIIIGDNVIRNGDIIYSESIDPKIQGVRSFYELLSQEPRISSTAIQTVGCKGYDGFSLALVVT